MLQVTELQKSFGGVKAVDRCSLMVEKGSITGLIGPNGAGKTSVFNLISGFCKPDGGEIRFDGARIDGLPAHRISKRAISRTFQNPHELKEMTVLENLMFVPGMQLGERLWNLWFRPRAVIKQERSIREMAIGVLEFVELVDLKDELAKNLSAGQKKLLELARTLMSDPKMILLDEPGAGVNPSLMKKLTKNIQDLRKRGKTFFIIEHDMDLIMNLCDIIIVMDKGKDLVTGRPETIQKDQRVLDAYLGGSHEHP
ncbi:MAG: ABC transporter ATP-binding protein [Thermodesulfobacteriota bacterium]|nr:ABC transporter ATP-binding protein [Thermodesulfobacteriota bacterium]